MALVTTLRDEVHLPLKLCHRALALNNFEKERAIEWLRKLGTGVEPKTIDYKERAERLEVQLAACGAAALGYAAEAKPGDYGWSASLGDVTGLYADRKRLHDQFVQALNYLREAKAKFCPNTTNSHVDDFLIKHKDVV
jgi:hypothetical protein